MAYRDRDPGIVGDSGSVSQSGTQPGHRVIKSEDGKAGTLVEDIPDMRDQHQRSALHVPADTAPEKVAKQPDEK